MGYVDGFVVPVPVASKVAYLEFARVVASIFKEHGALRVVECWGDDVPPGKLTSFPMAVKVEADEIVVFAWVEWPSRAARDAGMSKMMADPRMQPGAMTTPFDGKRTIFGGFEVILDE